MSDYYDDSFDSFESGSEHDSDSESAGPGWKQIETRLHVVQDPRMKELMSSMTKSGKSGSDIEESSNSSTPHSSTLKVERSPKPKRKFRIGNIKQRIKSKLWKDVAVFGVPLETAVQRSQLGADGIELPTVFREVIDFLEEYGLVHEGLYRLPGVKSKIEELKTRYDKGETIDLRDHAYDPNVVASTLKLYLRELPEPLIAPRLAAKFEAAAMLPPTEQAPQLLELLEEVPPLNRLMLGWLTVHMAHVAGQSLINKMSLPNLVIVFSPTLQIPAPALHALYHNCEEVFGDVELKKYERPTLERKGSAPGINLQDISSLETEEEITAELERLTQTLQKLHNKVAGKHDERREDNIWELQRAITELRRKKKAILKATESSRSGGVDEEFIKTLILMEATLAAENEELMAKKQDLQAAIRKEVELIEQFKKELEKYPSRSAHTANDLEEESGDEGELAKKVATLKWHGKELELRNRNLIKSIQEEEEAIVQLKVKLKVLPLKQKLNSDDQ